jgi:hypothetical protein
MKDETKRAVVASICPLFVTARDMVFCIAGRWLFVSEQNWEGSVLVQKNTELNVQDNYDRVYKVRLRL